MVTATITQRHPKSISNSITTRLTNSRTNSRNNKAATRMRWRNLKVAWASGNISLRTATSWVCQSMVWWEKENTNDAWWSFSGASLGVDEPPLCGLPAEQNKLQRGTSGHINDGSPETLHRVLRSSLKFYFEFFLFGFDETFMFAVQITPMEPFESFSEESVLKFYHWAKKMRFQPFI